MSWDDEQRFEADWWGDCTNTLGEQFKHPMYAKMMGVPFINDGGKHFIGQPDRSVLDIGGGPTSMLLYTRGATRRTVVDPCPYPDWTLARYQAAGIEVVRTPAEDFTTDHVYDEAWCYNVLQHVRDPKQVIDVMRRSARTIRMFEYVNLPAHPGHPHELKSKQLAQWGDFKRWEETEITYEGWVGQVFHGSTQTGL